LAYDKNKKRRQTAKTVIVYLAVSTFCFIFDKIYALFGHGVHSVSMSLMYLFPLLGGVLPFLLLTLIPLAEEVRHYRPLYNCYNSGIATLTAGSAINGVLEIAGTSSPYLTAFYVFGWSMLIIGLFTYLLNLHQLNLLNRK
jgi:hypothetical protein